MKKEITKRVLDESAYIIKTRQTIREIAPFFQVSKSTVHKDLNDRLKELNIKTYDIVQQILKEHTAIRHIRGGQSTKEKYSKEKK